MSGSFGSTYLAPTGHGLGSNRNNSLQLQPDFAGKVTSALLKYIGTPDKGFDPATIHQDQFGVADSLLKKWGGSMDVVQNTIVQSTVEFSKINTVVLPFKYARTLRLQMPIRTISRPMMQRTAEHAPYRKVVTSQEYQIEVLSRHAIGFDISSEVLADSPIGEQEYVDKMRAVVDSLKFAMEYDALEQLVNQASYEVMFLATRSIASKSSQFNDYMQVQISSYLALGKKGNGLEFLAAAADHIGQAIGVNYNTIILPSGARQLERAQNATTRKITIEVDREMAKLGGSADQAAIEINSYGKFNIITHTPVWDDLTKRMSQCPLSRPSATASYYPIKCDNKGQVIASMQIMDLTTHAKTTFTIDELQGQIDLIHNGVPALGINPLDVKQPDQFDFVLVRPAQYLATSSIVFCEDRGAAGNTYFHMSMLKFGNDTADGMHSVEGDAYFKAWVSNGRAVLAMHDVVPAGVLAGCGRKFMTNNIYNFVDTVSGNGGDLFVMAVPHGSDMNKPLAITKAALNEAGDFVMNAVPNNNPPYDAYEDKNIKTNYGFQNIEDTVTTGPVTQRTDFRNMDGRIPQFAFPGACWHANGNGEYTIERRNVGHLGCIDSPDCSKFLRGLYESADC